MIIDSQKRVAPVLLDLKSPRSIITVMFQKTLVGIAAFMLIFTVPAILVDTYKVKKRVVVQKMKENKSTEVIDNLIKHLMEKKRSILSGIHEDSDEDTNNTLEQLNNEPVGL